MTNKIIEALFAKYQADKLIAVANLQNYLNNSVGVGEHPDILEAVEKELEIIAKYHDQLEVIKTYFRN